MRWFHDLRLSAKLLTSFSAVLALVVGLGIFAIYEFNQIDVRVEEVASNSLPSIIAITAIADHTASIRFREFRYVLARDAGTRAAMMSEIDSFRTEIETVLSGFNALVDAGERPLVDAYLRDRDAYRQVQQQVFALADAGEVDEAVDLLTGESLRVFQQLDAAVTRIVEWNTEQGNTSAQAGLNATATARFLIMVGLLIAVLLGLGIAIYVARAIARPVVRLAEASRALAVGDVDVAIDIDTRDEVGDLARSFREMAEAQKQMAGAATAVAAGDVSVEIRPRGERDSLGQAFVELRRVVQALLNDTAQLIAAARDGRLASRADARSYRGGYADLLGGINELLDAVTRPIDEASATLEKLAARDLSARMNGEYRGDFAKVKDAVNTAATNLDDALSDVAVGSEQVAGASDQISAGSQVLAEGASEQASALEEISSSLQEMASMSRQNTANALEARTLADAARVGASRGVESMRRLSDAVARIKDSSDATAKIVRTIDEIAFQTNLLALNAAVEAARAGDAGKGFAVVAEEVRNLAMRSAEAAKNTAALIEEAVRNSDTGVEINADVLAKLEEIDAGVNKVGEVMAEITAASEQQTQGVDQISAAVEQMNGVTQQTAANSEESASAAEELSGQADRMRELVAGFTLSSNGTGTTRTTGGHRAAPSRRPASRAAAAAPARRGGPGAAPKRKNGNGGNGGNGHHAPRFDPSSVIPFGDDDDMDTLAEF